MDRRFAYRSAPRGACWQDRGLSGGSGATPAGRNTRSGDDRRAAGVVPGALHVPLSVLPWRADPDRSGRDAALARLDGEVILLCDHGYSSSLAAALLRHLGFTRAGDVDGGFEAWAAAGLPVEPVEPHILPE